MTWADSVPNLLIGLREGLEAGLVVTILLAAVRKTAGASTAPIWLGVLGAVSLAGAFATVLTFSVSVLTSAGQEAVGGLLSVLAVCLVTAMIFWMRRTAAALSRQLRGEVERAAAIGAGALTLTAFLSVGREGLETTLFLWTAARASGHAAGPLVGAAIGIGAAVLLCWLLFRRAIRLNVGVFFNRTALALIVIAAGVLAYGLGDLQDAGWLPGHAWTAFDLTAQIDPNSWWASIVTGLTELAPRMTMLQVTAWLGYLALVVPAFVNAGRAQPGTPSAARPALAATPAAPARWERVAGGRPWAVAGVLIAVPALVAGVTVAALPTPVASTAATVTVSRTDCAPEWTAAGPGTVTVTVTDNAGLSGEVDLDNAAGAVVGEIETIGPGTSVPLTATLADGTYTFKCLMGSLAARSSLPVTVSSASGGALAASADTPVAVKPVTAGELAPANALYRRYAAAQLTSLASQAAAVTADLTRGGLAQAKADWLAAQLDWERVGASYDSFGSPGLAVDGLPDGLPRGVSDPAFTGLKRLEYGLWNGQPATQLLPAARALQRSVADVQRSLASDGLAGDPTQLPVRAHEIIEDALRDHLSGTDDQGGGAAYPMTYADAQVDETVLGELAGLIDARQPGLVAAADSELAALRQALLATRSHGQWQPLAAVTRGQRQRVDGAADALLQTLSAVPDLLEVPPTH